MLPSQLTVSTNSTNSTWHRIFLPTTVPVQGKYNYRLYAFFAMGTCTTEQGQRVFCLLNHFVSTRYLDFHTLFEEIHPMADSSPTLQRSWPAIAIAIAIAIAVDQDGISPSTVNPQLSTCAIDQDSARDIDIKYLYSTVPVSRGITRSCQASETQSHALSTVNPSMVLPKQLTTN